MNEETLIRQAQGGDIVAFNRLVVQYQELVFNVAYRIMNDPAVAEDVAQETFITAYQSLKTFRGGSFKSWLMRVATNRCYDELRRRKRHPQTPLEPVSDEDGEEIESPYWLADSAPSPEEALDQRELERAVQHCLEGLPADFRAAIVMVDLEGLDYQDASVAVGTPIGTIKSRVARARLKLRECLQGFGELLPALFRQKKEDIS